MCLICVELIKQRMTLTEAKRAAGEYSRVEGESRDQDKHISDLYDALTRDDFEKLGELLDEIDV